MKKILIKGKLEESLLVAMLLALVGGYLDIYSYMARGKVFANTQTGNLVLLGSSIAQGNKEKTIYYLLSIFAFIGGVGLAKWIEHKFQVHQYFDWLQLIVVIEIILLLLVMWIPEGRANVLANMVVSFACGLQVQGFRKVNGNSYSTIMFTGNLKNGAERLFHYFITKDLEALENGIVFVSIIGMFVIGGGIGTLTTAVYHTKAVGLSVIALGSVVVLLNVDKRLI